MPKNQSNNGLAEPLLLLLVVFLEGKLLFFNYFKTVRVRNKLMYIKNKRNSRFPKKTRGLFFYINSVALIEDLPLEEEYHSLEDFYAAANRAYNQVNFELFNSEYQLYSTLIISECLQLLDCCMHLRAYIAGFRTTILHE